MAEPDTYNGGTLSRRGGKRPGAGRRPDELKQQLLAAGSRGLAKVISPYIDDEPIATLDKDGKIEVKPDPALRLKAAEAALRYALSGGVPESEVRKRLKETCDMLHEVLPDPEAALVVARMRTIWT